MMYSCSAFLDLTILRRIISLLCTGIATFSSGYT
jgi:hypothetical protein